MRTYFRGTISIFVSWLVGYFFIRTLGMGLSTVEAYALINGWWLCAYVASKFEISLIAVIPGGVIYFVAFIMAALSGQDFFYRDIQGVGLAGILAVAALQTLMFVSPIIFNSIVGFILTKLR